MAIALDTASLIALCVESILFGLLAALVAVTIHLLFAKRRVRPLQKPIVVVAVSMLLLAFIHLTIDMQRILRAFTGGDKDAVTYLNDLEKSTYVVKNAVHVMQTLLGDGFVIYRVYIVWNYKRWIVGPPLVLLVASCVTGIYTIVSEARLAPSAPVFALKNWVSTFFSITLFTNFSCTALIAYKIWSTTRQTGQLLSTSGVHSRSTFSALMIVVESGAIYSISLVTLLATFLSGSWSQYIALDAVVQIIGIVFTLIIVRIGLGLSSEKALTTQHTSQASNVQLSVRSRGQTSRVKAVEVQMTTHKHEARDGSPTRTRDDVESGYDLDITGKSPESDLSPV